MGNQFRDQWLKIAEKLRPQDCIMRGVFSEDGAVLHRKYVWDEDKEGNIVSEPTWGKRRRLNFANRLLYMATRGNQTIIHKMSSTGRFLGSYVVSKQNLLDSGYVRNQNLTENYALFVENRAEQLKLNPQEDDNVWQLAPKSEIENVVKEVHTRNINDAPTSKSSMFDDFGTREAIILVGVVVLFIFMRSQGMI